jgi:hypothetical protein
MRVRPVPRPPLSFISITELFIGDFHGMGGAIRARSAASAPSTRAAIEQGGIDLPRREREREGERKERETIGARRGAALRRPPRGGEASARVTRAKAREEGSTRGREREQERRLDASDGVDVDVAAVVALLKLKPTLLVVAVHRRVVDHDALRELPERLELARLVGRVLEDNVALVVLLVAERDEDDVARGDPNLLPHLSADVALARRAVEALRLEAPVAEHAEHLRVLC